MKFHLSLDTVAVGVIALLTVVIGLVILLSGQVGVRVTATLPERSLIGPFQKIKLTFSEPVDPDLIAPLFSIQPNVDGTTEWLDPRTLQFVPSRPFEPGVNYRLSLSLGPLSKTGSALKREQSWEFHVRDPLVVYLLAGESQSSLWTVSLQGEAPRQISPSEIKIISFDASTDGEFIVFTSANEKGGISLWRMSRAGGDASVLLDCGLDRCSTPAIAPDGNRIAYSREAAVGAGLPYGSPRVWILDLKNGQNSPVYEDKQVLGYNPSWSPDSKKLISFDGLADQFRLFDLSTNKQLLFPSNTGGRVTWSPDSSKFLFTDIDQKESGLITRVRLADLSLNDTSTLLGGSDDRDYAYYSLAWSPVKDDSVIVSLRTDAEQPSQAFWLFNPGLLDGIMIADQPEYTYNSPRWDPWGTALVFQQFKLRGQFKPEISLWKSGFRDPLIIAEGVMPHWLP